MRLNSPQMNIMYKACLKASKGLIRDFGEVEKLQVSTKGPGDFVTSADKRTEKIIITELLKGNEDYGILSEEVGEMKKNSSKRWVVDPIDGTLNFLNGIPHFAISVAYEENGEIKSGIIFDVIKNEIFAAEKGNGSFLNNYRIRVSKKRKMKESFLVTGGPKNNNKNREYIFNEYKDISNKVDAPIRKFGSAALDLAYVACGRFDGFWQKDLNFWDIAAGQIILKEAGGFVDLINNDNSLPNKNDIIASNSIIHEELYNTIM